jgi:hypothetical protein
MDLRSDNNLGWHCIYKKLQELNHMLDEVDEACMLPDGIMGRKSGKEFKTEDEVKTHESRW